jgi:SAM-dependent methyltransferase
MFYPLKLIKRNVAPERWARWAALARKLRGKAGFEEEAWLKITQVRAWREFLLSLPLDRLDALEISPGSSAHWRDIGFRSYTAVQYPEFDITRDRLPRRFDVVIADQVFEHVQDPVAAARNVHAMLADDGLFLMAAPFLVKIHGAPNDYTRWTPDGMRTFLARAGFDAEIHAWGNRHAVTANLYHAVHYGWRRDLRNEPDFPVNVWAYARKRNSAAS